MIFLLNKSVYNGDALARLKAQPGDSLMHQYYTVGMRLPLEVADVIREYNIVKCTVLNSIIYASGNAQDWIWLVRLFRDSKNQGQEYLADNIEAALPDVFRNTTLARR